MNSDCPISTRTLRSTADGFRAFLSMLPDASARTLVELYAYLVETHSPGMMKQLVEDDARLEHWKQLLDTGSESTST